MKFDQVVLALSDKCYKGSELEDVLIVGGVIAEGSVNRALKGKHYKKGPCCLRLMYEALMSQLMQERLTPHMADETNLDILRDTFPRIPCCWSCDTGGGC